MDSSTHSGEYRKELDNQLADDGKRLTKLPSSNDDLPALEITYNDDKEESLNQEKERREFFNEKKPGQMLSSQSSLQEPIETNKKTSKRKVGSLKPQSAPSASKRTKTKGRRFFKSGSSTFRYINLNEDSDDDLFW